MPQMPASTIRAAVTNITKQIGKVPKHEFALGWFMLQPDLHATLKNGDQYTLQEGRDWEHGLVQARSFGGETIVKFHWKCIARLETIESRNTTAIPFHDSMTLEKGQKVWLAPGVLYRVTRGGNEATFGAVSHAGPDKKAITLDRSSITHVEPVNPDDDVAETDSEADSADRAKGPQSGSKWSGKTAVDQVRDGLTNVVMLGEDDEEDDELVDSDDYEEEVEEPFEAEQDDEEDGQAKEEDDCENWDGHRLELPKESSIEVTTRVKQWKGNQEDSMRVLLKPKKRRVITVEVTHLDHSGKKTFMKGRVVNGMKDLLGIFPVFDVKFACGLAKEDEEKKDNNDGDDVGEEDEEGEKDEEDKKDGDYVGEEEDEDDEDSYDEDEDDEDTGILGPSEKPCKQSKVLKSTVCKPDAKVPDPPAVVFKPTASVPCNSYMVGNETIEQGLYRMKQEFAQTKLLAKLQFSKHLVKYVQNRKGSDSLLLPLQESAVKAHVEFTAAGLKEELPVPKCIRDLGAARNEPLMTARKAFLAIQADSIQRFQKMLSASTSGSNRLVRPDPKNGTFCLTDAGIEAKAKCVDAAVRYEWASIVEFSADDLYVFRRCVTQLEPTSKLLADLGKVKTKAHSSKPVASSPTVAASDKKRGAESSSAPAPKAKRGRK